MNVKQGIRANGEHSYEDYDLYLKSREIGLPEKKSIRQTVPYMNGYYDFSALNGAPAWNERKIAFTFDLIQDTPEALDAYVASVQNWLCNVHDVDISDDTMRDYHWHGSYESCDVSWDETGLQAEVKVTFVVHPFKIADYPTEYRLQAGTHTIYNRGMAVAPYTVSESTAAIQIGSYVSSISANEKTRLEIDLVRGENTVVVTGDKTVTLGFYEEVL